MLGGINPLMMGGGGPSFTPDTWNPSDKDAGVTLSNSNRTAAASGANQGVRSIRSRMSGKLYLEYLADAVFSTFRVGLANGTEGLTNQLGSSVNSIACYQNGNIFYNGSSVGSVAALTATDVVMIAFDRAANLAWFGKNGTWTGNPAAGTGGFTLPTGSILAMASPGTSGQTTVRFGTTGLSYPPPSGFSQWDS